MTPRTIVLAALVLTAFGCSKERRFGGRGERAESEQSAITVYVENRNFADATIYAIYQSSRVRLGQVTGHSEGEFTMGYVPTDLRFEIDLLAGGSYRTESIVVSPGESLELVIGSDLGQTRIYR